MKTYEIIFIILLIVYAIAIPSVKGSKIFQFIMLIIMPFIISYLLFVAMQKSIYNIYVLLLLVLFFGNLIYQAVKFYKKYLL